MNLSVKSEPWDFWHDGAHPPALNMALDEALLETAPGRGRPLLRFYRWDRPAVSIGYIQKFSAAPAAGYAIVRRPTGGGVVFHDHDFTYTVVIPSQHWLAGVDRMQSYAFINTAVQAGLAECRIPAALAETEIPHTVDRLTMVCFKTPTRYDVMDGARHSDGVNFILRQTHFGGDIPGHIGGPDLVKGGVGIPHFDGGYHDLQRAVIGFA